MPDSISILASSAAHGNVATETPPQSFTRRLVGYSGGTVPLALQRKSNALDVSEYAQLRLELDVTALTGLGNPSAASLYVSIEHSADGLRWDLLHAFEPMRGVGKQRIVLGAFEGRVRASWFHARIGSEQAGFNDVFTWSLTGHAAPALPE